MLFIPKTTQLAALDARETASGQRPIQRSPGGRNCLHGNRTDLVLLFKRVVLGSIIAMLGWLHLSMLPKASACMSDRPIQDEPIPEFKPQPSTLSQYTEALVKSPQHKDYFVLKPKAGMLAPDFAMDGGASRNLLQSVANKIKGASGSGSSGSGGNSWSVSYRGSKLSISSGFGRNYWNPSQTFVVLDDEKTFYLKLNDSGDSQAQVMVTAKLDKTLRVRVSDLQGAYTFSFRQTPDGKISCVEIGPDFQFAASSGSFDQFAAEHPDYLNQRLTKLFRYAGIGVPPSRFHPFVREHVVSLLKPVDEGRLKEFNELVRPMDEGDFSEREAAMANLDEQFKDWESFIQIEMQAPSRSVEVRSRLKKIYGRNVESSKRELLNLVRKDKLTENPDYLVWILSSIDQDEVGKQAIIEQLEKTTDQSFGSGVSQWVSWSRKQRPASSGDGDQEVTVDDLLKSKGEIEETAAAIGDLIRFKVADGNLKIDEDHWKKTLGGKTIDEATEDVRQRIRELNLPANWFKPGTGQYPESTVKFPQLAFDRIISGQEIDPQFSQRRAVYSRYTINSANRLFVGKDLIAELETHPNTSQNGIMMAIGGVNRKQAKITQSYLKLLVLEKRDPKRRFDVYDDKKGNLVCSLEYGDDAMLRLTQRTATDNSEPGCQLAIQLGSKIQVLRARDFETMAAENKSELQKVAPLFKQFGILLNE